MGHSRLSKEEKIMVGCFLATSIILLTLFTYIPALKMFYYSFTDWNGVNPEASFIGLSNYKYIFDHPELLEPLKVSIFYLVASIIQIALALVLATFLTYNIRFKNFFKGVYFFPTIINSVAIGFMFILYFQPDGTLNSTLTLLGIDSTVKWLGNPSLVNYSLAFASVWRYIGLNIVMFSAAITSLNSDMFESASIDGASKFQEFRHLILPGVKRIIQINAFLAITGALTVFEMPFIITNGGNGSKTFVMQSIETAFSIKRGGLASALSVLLITIVIVLALIQKVYTARRQNEA